MQKRNKPSRRKKARTNGVMFPHESRELQLMLKGKKQLARFTRKRDAAWSSEVEAAFAPYVA